ncbi:MAG TPA: glycoside hydrolase family 3 C-terminal domain-containing protein [Mycobacteriales bacterium]|nr:glycoside hydrolase family 3 C-terminal domain-containing protein [Mycobacteriales bacterium]
MPLRPRPHARRLLALGLSTGVAVALAPGLTRGSAPHAQAATCPWMDASKTADERAHELVAAMSLDQKLAELYGRGDITHYGAANYIPAIPALCVPQMVFNDAGAGLGDGKLLVTAFPDGITQAASWDVAMQRRVGAAIGFEAWHKGVNVQLAPGVDIARTPLNGRNFEYAGEDPYLAGQTGAAEIEGIQSQHVVATVKHYALNDQETNRMTDSSDADERTMQEIHLPAFEAAVKQAHVGSVMCSYNRVNGVYACENPYLLNTVLKGQFGFDGFVMSDWGGTHSTVPAALNGLDQEQNVTQGTYFAGALKTAVQAGQVPVSRVNDMVERIMRSMFAVGAFDDVVPTDPQASLADVNTDEEKAIAREAAEGGAVLLKNTGNALPIHGNGKRIALIGDPAGVTGSQSFYQGGGSSKVPITGTNPSVVSPLQGITTRAAADGDIVTYSPALTITDAAAVAAAADVAVVFVGDGESEGVDRKSLAPAGGVCALVACTPQVGADQDKVVAAVAAANPNTIVVLQVGGPVLMPWLDQVKGVLDMWYPGEQDGNAAASLLFGDVNPSGKLPFTFPTSLAQTPTPSAAQYPGIADKNGIPHSTYSEGLLVGYRWYDAKKLTPLFPFGFGLSYTTFGFSGLSVAPKGTSATATFTVRNTGARTGAEVPQLYVADPAASGEPPKQLKGYTKVTLGAGQSTQVTLSLDQRAFSHWDTKTHSWKVTKGCYTILAGDSSRNLPLSAKIGRGGASCGATSRSVSGTGTAKGSSGGPQASGVTPPEGSLAATGLSTGIVTSVAVALLGAGAALARRRSRRT